MPGHLRPSAQGFARRLALFYAVLFVVYGVHMPFFPVWLEAKGLDARTIGLVLAVPMVVRVLALPFVTREADRRNALPTALMIGMLATTAGYALLGFAQGNVMIFIGFAIASLAFTPTLPLLDAYAIEGLHARKRAYGPVRLWGSATFIAGNLAGGALLDVISGQHLIWLIVAPMAATAAATFMLTPVHHTPPAPGPAPRTSALLRDPAFIAVVVAASLIQASHALFYGFSTIDWKAAGLDGSTIGALWATGIVAEIVLFAFSGRLPQSVGPVALLSLGAAGAVIRWTGMAADPPFWSLPLLQCLHALSYGATHLGTLGLLTRVAPRNLAATAQGYLSLAMGLINAVATALAGWLYSAYGDQAYAAMALTAVMGGLVVLAARPGWAARRRG